MLKTTICVLLTPDLKQVILLLDKNIGEKWQLPCDDVLPCEAYYDTASRIVLQQLDLYIQSDKFKLIGKISHTKKNTSPLQQICIYSTIVPNYQQLKSKNKAAIRFSQNEITTEYFGDDVAWIVNYAIFANKVNVDCALKLSTYLNDKQD